MISYRARLKTVTPARIRRSAIVIMLIARLLANIPSTNAAPKHQADSVARCAKGVQLYLEGQLAEALPLLEAGFAGRKGATFPDPDDLGSCALALGYLREGTGHPNGALEAFAVALQGFQTSGNRRLEGLTLAGIARIYHTLGRYADALETQRQVLLIMREVGDRVGEGRTLNYLGTIYRDQGRYTEALDHYQQALASQRAVSDRAGEGATLSNIGTVYREQSRYIEALDTFQQAVAILREVGDRAGEGQTLNNVGIVYYAQGRYTEALEALQKALTINRQVEDRAGEGETLNSIGGVYQAQGRYKEALDSFQQVLKIRRQVGDREGEEAALNNMGVIYRSQGRYADALDTFQQALMISRELGDRSGEGTALNNIGLVYQDQARYVEALQAYLQGLGIWREIGNRAEEGTTINNIGTVYGDQGRYAEALNYYQQALAIRRTLGNRASEGGTLTNIGEVLRTQGHYAEALDSLQQALAILREVGDRASEGTTLENIALIYYDQGRYAEALESLQQALTMQREVGDRAGEGESLNGIGAVYQANGRYAEALVSYQQALTIRHEVGDYAGEGTTLNNIGAVYFDQGRYTEALNALEQALMIHREVGNHDRVGTTLDNIGKVYHIQGKYTEALTAYQEALTIGREVGNRSGEGTALNNIGEIYRAQGRTDEALEPLQLALAISRELGDRPSEGVTLNNIGLTYEQKSDPAQALSHYAQAMDALEAVRTSVGSEAGRASFIAQYASLYGLATALYYREGQHDMAFLTSERSRARAFLDSLATGYVQLSDQDAATLQNREREVYAARQAIQDALVRARALNPSDPALVADLEKQLVAAEQQHAEALAAIEQRGVQLAALVPSRTKGVLDRPAVQQLLDSQTTLVSYYVLDNQTLAFILTRDRSLTVNLPARRNDLLTQIRALRAFPNLNEAYPASAVHLYSWLIAPLKQHLTTPHVVIVPHSVLHYLPFAALTDGTRYLVDDYALTTLPSASALRFIKENVRNTVGPPLIIGNPATPHLKPLTFAEREAQAIGTLYGITPLLGSAATKAAVNEGAVQAGILHLAAHGSYNRHSPLDSVIALAPNPSGTDDGRLTVAEVYGLKLRAADLVVLSACETQINDLSAGNVVSAGDELVGLTRAFFFAGTPSVIATLWSVDDEATALLMERFYTHLRAGMGKAAALRQAQIDVRAKYPNPYYWSGFVLSGDSGIRAQSGVSLWIWLTGGVVVGLVVFLIRHRRA
jgi:tetratricopeptide (TPR) repeat protein